MTPSATGHGLAARVFRNSLYLLGGQMGARLMGLAISILVARHLGTESFGHYTFVLTMANFGYLAAQYGLDRLLMRMIARDPGKASSHAIAGAAARLAIVAGAAPLFLVLAAFQHKPPDVRLGMAIMAGALAFHAVAQTLENAFSGMERMAVPSAARFASKAAQLGMVATAVHFKLGFAWFVGALAMSEVVRAGSMAAAWRWHGAVRPAAGEVGRFLRDGLPFFGIVMCAGLTMRMELFLMGFLPDATALGRYGAAYSVAEAFLLISTAVTTSLFPSFARFARDHDAAGISRAYERSAGMLMVLAIPISVSLAILAPKAIETAFGREFLPAAPVLSILIWNVPLAFLTAPLNRILEAWDSEGALLKVLGAASVASFAFALPAIGWFGIQGAAASNVAMRVLLTVMLVTAVGRRVPGMAYPVATIVRCLPGAALLAAVCWFLRDASWVVLVVAGSAVYWGGAVACRAVGIAEILALLRRKGNAPGEGA